MSVDAVRSYIAGRAAAALAISQEAEGRSPVFDATAHSLASIHIQRITDLVRELAKAEPASEESRALVERIDDELMMLQQIG